MHFKRIILFIYFIIVIIIVGHAGSSSQPGLSLVSVSGVLSNFGAQVSYLAASFCCRAQALGHALQAQYLQHVGSVVEA